MNKEILFRAKRIDTREWAYGYYVCLQKIQPFKSNGEQITRPGPPEERHLIIQQGSVHIDSVEVDPKTVGQFTGACDANGKKIFEGDVMYNRKREGFDIIQGPDEKEEDERTIECYEIIGNIWDDPRLKSGYPVPERYKEE